MGKFVRRVFVRRLFFRRVFFSRVFFGRVAATLAVLASLLVNPLLVKSLSVKVAWAEPAEDDAAVSQVRQRKRIVWRPEWRRVGWPEAVVTGSALVATWSNTTFVEKDPEPNWTGPILFDAWVREHLVFDKPVTRNTAAVLSDVSSFVLVAQNVVVDGILVVGFHDDNPEVAWELLMIDAQSYAINGLVTNVTKTLAGRQRPFRGACAKDRTYSKACNSTATNRSFFSGHSSFSGTSAGLICAHHAHLPLYGGGGADLGACLGAISFAVGTGAMRISSDVHWASDVIVGHLSGFLIGFLVPDLLYYRDSPSFKQPSEQGRRTHFWTLAPDAGPNRLGLQAIGLF